MSQGHIVAAHQARLHAFSCWTGSLTTGSSEAVTKSWCAFVQTVMLGSGMDEYESAMRGLEAAHPAHFRGWVGFSIPVAHRIVAGAQAWT